MSSGGFDGIARAVRTAALKCATSMGLEPRTKATAELLQKLVVDACREVDAELLGPSKAPTTLLPDDLDAKVSEANRAEVKRLLDEARDYLESPQFLQVFQGATSKAAEVLAKGLVAEASGEGPWPLAKLHGTMIKC